MKIGFFYVPYYPLTTSRSVHGYQLVKALRKRGHQILSCLGDNNPDCVNYERTKSGALKLARQADVLYIRITGRPVQSFLEKSTLLKLTRPFSLPVVWEINAPVEEVRASEPHSPDREALIRRENRKRKALAHLVDAAIGVSDVLKNYIQDFLHIQRAYCIPNGADPYLFDESHIKETALFQLKDTFKILWMGNASTPWQGIEVILEVARKMLAIDPDILFILITGDSMWDFPVLKNLLVLREVAYETIPHYLASADLCLCLYKPYDWIEYGFYGSSLKLFDYMAAGKPVIASDMGQLSDIIKNDVNGVLVGQDVMSIIDRIRDLKANEHKRKLLGARARKDVVDYYNWDRVAQQTEEVLNEVLRG